MPMRPPPGHQGSIPASRRHPEPVSPSGVDPERRHTWCETSGRLGAKRVAHFREIRHPSGAWATNGQPHATVPAHISEIPILTASREFKQDHPDREYACCAHRHRLQPVRQRRGRDRPSDGGALCPLLGGWLGISNHGRPERRRGRRAGDTIGKPRPATGHPHRTVPPAYRPMEISYRHAHSRMAGSARGGQDRSTTAKDARQRMPGHVKETGWTVQPNQGIACYQRHRTRNRPNMPPATPSHARKVKMSPVLLKPFCDCLQ